MPELPEVETIKRDLKKNLINKTLPAGRQEIKSVEIKIPKLINVSVPKFKKIIKFNFTKVVITIILMVTPAFIIKTLVESMPPVDKVSSMETVHKYTTYVGLPNYPIKLVKKTLASTCKLAAPPSDDIFRCYGKFMSTIYLILSISYNYFLACLIYIGFKKLKIEIKKRMSNKKI